MQPHPAFALGRLELIGIVLLIALVAAAFSGRIWAVVLGLVGLFVMLAGGLLLGGAYFVLHRRVELANVPATVETPDMRPNVPPAGSPGATSVQLAEAPDPGASGALPADAATAPRRPEWVDAEEGKFGDVYRRRVEVGPYQTRSECEQKLPAALQEAVRDYANRLLGEGKGQDVNLSSSYIQSQWVRSEWAETRDYSVGPMVTLHALLQFDTAANRVIEENHHRGMVERRLGYTAVGGGLLLGLLTAVYGYLKLDTLTKGYYTGRLRLASGTAILLLAAITGLLMIG